MAQIRGSDAKVLFNGVEIGTTGIWWDEKDAVLTEVAFERVKTYTFRGKFVPSPELDAVMVGLQLRYGLRELHRNLGRYARWPYVN